MHAPIAVTIQDACRMIGIGRSSLYELIASGTIEARKSGSRTVILVDSLRAYVASLPRFPAGAS